MTWGVVIPTIREELFIEWLEAWKPILEKHNVTLYVCEDHKTKKIKIDTSKYKFKINHYCWKDIDKDLGKDAWIIPRKCDGIRSYGYLKAYQDHCYYIWTVDDDCFPHQPMFGDDVDILEEYTKVFMHGTTWTGDYYDVSTHTLGAEQKMRGMPFKYRDKKIPVIQYGVWHNIPDYDGITQLAYPDEVWHTQSINLVPKHQALTGCIMNAAWNSSATPFMYQLLMGEVKGKKMPYNRWGDIWSGLLAKKVCDEHDMCIAINGYAVVEHTRASNVQKNIEQEASGYAPNEVMWDILSPNYYIREDDENKLETYISTVKSIGNNGYVDREWYALLLKAVQTWVKYFEKDDSDSEI